jgi:hypothetical protein
MTTSATIPCACGGTGQIHRNASGDDSIRDALSYWTPCRDADCLLRRDAEFMGVSREDTLRYMCPPPTRDADPTSSLGVNGAVSPPKASDPGCGPSVPPAELACAESFTDDTPCPSVGGCQALSPLAPGCGPDASDTPRRGRETSEARP